MSQELVGDLICLRLAGLDGLVWTAAGPRVGREPFAKLSREFEACVYGLNIVKNELEVMQHPIARHANDLIM